MKKLFILLAAVIVAVGMMAQPPHRYETERGHGHGPGHNHGSERHIVCASPDQLSMTLQVVGNQSFDDKKLEIAKLAVTLGHFCTDDLARVAQLFSFDDNRLTFLLYAHAYCEDPQNYPILRDAFAFQSNYDKLMQTLYPGRR
jgi:hypothetical protein